MADHADHVVLGGSKVEAAVAAVGEGVVPAQQLTEQVTQVQAPRDQNFQHRGRTVHQLGPGHKSLGGIPIGVPDRQPPVSLKPRDQVGKPLQPGPPDRTEERGLVANYRGDFEHWARRASRRSRLGWVADSVPTPLCRIFCSARSRPSAE